MNEYLVSEASAPSPEFNDIDIGWPEHEAAALRCGCPLCCSGVSLAPGSAPDDGGPLSFVPPTSGTAANGKPVFSWSQAAEQLSRNSDGWGRSPGTPATVTYAYRSTAPATLPNEIEGFSRFNAAQIAATETVLRLWSDVANIQFNRVGEGSSGDQAYSNSATILFSNYSSGEPGASAFAYLPGSAGVTSLAGDVWVNNSLASNQDLTFGEFGIHTIAHEVGHAIGLSHPGNYDGEGQSYAASAEYWQDARQYTVMSYFGSSNTDGSLNAFSAGPQLHDIAAVQRLYGVNTSTRTGDTIYGFNSNTGLQHFTLTSNTSSPVFSVWDAGGTDTFDFSGYSSALELDLREEAFSSAGPGNGNIGLARGNISIARGAVIENAIGGAGNDLIIGNASANTLDGRNGDDSLYGGAGNDIFLVDRQTDLVFELANEGDDLVQTTANYYLFAQIERLTLASAAGNIFGVGNDLANTILGNEGENLLLGGAGNDTISGGAARDAIFGEAGADTLNGEAGIDYLVGGDGNDTINGGDDPDELYGEAGDDVLNAGGGFLTDILVGGDGNDTLNGASGAADFDLMDGGAGDDTYRVDTGDDLTFEALGGGTDTVIADVKVAGAGVYLYANVEHLVLEGTTAFGVGNELANSLAGSSSANVLLGGAGNDTLNGKAGNDVLFGELGADTFVLEFGTGADTIGDFTAGTDRIQLVGYGLAFSQLQSALVQVGADVAIDLPGADVAILLGVSASALSASDFLFA